MRQSKSANFHHPALVSFSEVLDTASPIDEMKIAIEPRLAAPISIAQRIRSLLLLLTIIPVFACATEIQETQIPNPGSEVDAGSPKPDARIDEPTNSYEPLMLNVYQRTGGGEQAGLTIYNTTNQNGEQVPTPNIQVGDFWEGATWSEANMPLSGRANLRAFFDDSEINCAFDVELTASQLVVESAGQCDPSVPSPVGTYPLAGKRIRGAMMAPMIVAMNAEVSSCDPAYPDFTDMVTAWLSESTRQNAICTAWLNCDLSFSGQDGNIGTIWGVQIKSDGTLDLSTTTCLLN